MESLVNILLFAGIAVFLLLRLRDVFGEHHGEDEQISPMRRQDKSQETNTPQKDDKSKEDRVVKLVKKGNTFTVHVDQDAEEEGTWPSDLPNFKWVSSATVHNKLREMVAIDPDFHPAEFLEGAERAYEMIVEAMNANDRDVIESLVAPEFIGQINLEDEERPHIEVEVIDSSIIQMAKVSGTVATVGVTFKARISGLSEHLIDGDAADTDKAVQDALAADLDKPKPISVEETWCFKRDLRSDDPRWQLSEIKEAVDA